MKKLDKILSIIIVVLLISILTGTFIALSKNKETMKQQKQLISQGKAVSLMAPKNDGKLSYFNLGSLRVLTEPEKKQNASQKNSFQQTQTKPAEQNKQTEQTDQTEQKGTVLLVTPWISYPSEDTVFFEEISRKKTVIAGIIQDYFSRHSKQELLAQTEVKIEENLLQEINSHLSLGKIQQIYFTDFIFLE